MKFKCLNAVLAGIALSASCLINVANAGLIYSNDFQTGSAAGFSGDNTVVTAPSGESFIGHLNNGETPILNLTGLESHSSITIDFDVYGIRSLDGTANQDNFEFLIDGVSQFIDYYGHTGKGSGAGSGGTIIGPTTGVLVSHDLATLGYGHFGVVAVLIIIQ